MSSKETNSHSGALVFIKDIAKYFMDFLESDFHKRKNPKRSIRLRDSDNLLVGINVNKYPSFAKLVGKETLGAFQGKTIRELTKGIHRSHIPNNLINLVELQVKKISQEQVSTAISAISNEIEKAAATHKTDYDQALTTSLEAGSEIIKRELVLPFVKQLEKPIENQNLGDENTIYLMEEELTAVLIRLIENKILELLNNLFAGNNPKCDTELASVLALNDVCPRVLSFFQNFKVGDLFEEVFELERNRRILDKQEFYLYFCDVQFDKAKYPIFYIPFAVERSNDRLAIEFDYQVYINKKALEYIVQEYNVQKDIKGRLQTVTERIIYLSQHVDDFEQLVNSILSEISLHFGLDGTIDLRNPGHQKLNSLLVQVSNASYISLFDKSDEALVNDYEDILQLLSEDDNLLAGIFNTLIDDFIHKNPKSFYLEIADEWEDSETNEKLVFTSPIPLNSEQLQILSAVRKDECRYIIVEGPPGTGKSHTITAIVFDAILKNQSVLVLSDKKEALDVVEDKITATLKSVRMDDRFQNPILRLGKIGSNYSQILSTTAINDIKNHYLAVRKGYGELEENISKIGNTLRDDLEAEILAYGEIDISEIQELIGLEVFYEREELPFKIEELIAQRDPDALIEEIRKILLNIKTTISHAENHCGPRELLEWLKIPPRSLKTLKRLGQALDSLGRVSEIIERLRSNCEDDVSSLDSFNEMTDQDIDRLRKYLSTYGELKQWLLGYLFRRKKLEQLDGELQTDLPTLTLAKPHQNIDIIESIVRVCDIANELKAESKWSEQLDFLRTIHRFLTDSQLSSSLGQLLELREDLAYLNKQFKRIPQTFEELGIHVTSLESLCDNRLTSIESSEFDRLVRYIHLRDKILKAFHNIPSYSYSGALKELENLVTAQMTYLLDGRLVDFYEHNKATARALRDIIRKKQRFPKDEFSRLKEAFPCILAGIRDYAEYIPLEPEIFDLVIIDEASQVSIAQAFPALLRAKKILILGDRKQFSNVKAAQARTATNREYLNALQASFKKNVSQEPTKLVKLEKFNIKTSILEFFEFINNYHSQLLKHFRGYKEIISYSNQFFYQNSLQVMKIRGKPAQEVLQFAMIEHDSKKELIPNTNSLEVDFIVEEISKLMNAKSQSSVGIITPHTNQQKLLVDRINELPERSYFFDKLNLKIMTFDTCQGEERDIIYYSMVANPVSDRLWGVFIKDLSSVDIEEESKIKAQRLNVGFSRAKEKVVFVLSKPLKEFSGSIGQALRHYHLTLEEAMKERDVSEVDSSSKMEPAVLNWFYQTEFWRDNKDNVSFIPQFKIGKYLKQLDPNYQYPEYQVDFLLVCSDQSGKAHNIVIEYDGFREHFDRGDAVTKYNYENYYSDEDVYREKVLEGYGYRFLRINKFNVGHDPIGTLNHRILDIINGTTQSNSVISGIHKTIHGLQSGEMKECPKCKEVRTLAEFKDTSLVTGYGRFCNDCKGIVSQPQQRDRQRGNATDVDKTCPKCGAAMILRTGRYGKFYGCTKFPYCKGTRNYIKSR